MPENQRLQRDIRDLSNDLVKAVSSLTVMQNANKDSIADLRRRADENDKTDHTAEIRMETRLAQIEAVLEPLRDAAQRLAVIEKVLSGVEDVDKKVADLRVEQGGNLAHVESRKIDLEDKKNSRALYATIATAALPGIGALIMKLIEWFGSR